MAKNIEVNYKVKSRQDMVKVIEHKVNNYKSGPDIIGYKIKIGAGACWLSKEQFYLIFEAENELF